MGKWIDALADPLLSVLTVPHKALTDDFSSSSSEEADAGEEEKRPGPPHGVTAKTDESPPRPEKRAAPPCGVTDKTDKSPGPARAADDDRVTCAACLHFAVERRRCGNFKRAGLRTPALGLDLPALLQRCPGYLAADGRVTLGPGGGR